MNLRLVEKISNLVVLPHSVFALPFALASFAIALAAGPTIQLGHPTFILLLLVVGAVVAARTAAMAFNRLVDQEFDALNPRTKARELPAGILPRRSAWILVVAALLLFFVCVALLGIHCLRLAPAVMLVLLGYSFTKRFTSSSHLVLGLALALAPGGAWWVIRPQIETIPLLLMGAVLFWVAGFDTLYSCQDESFDREHRLKSIPARVGIRNALLIARLFHSVAFLLFIGVGLAAKLSNLYFLGLIPVGGLLFYQHWLLSPTDLSRINRAFFTTNGFVSGFYLVLVLVSR